jgi:acyl dehydratase
VSDILTFEDFPVGKSFEFGRYEISAAQIDSYAAAFDCQPARGANGGSAVRPTASPLQLCAILMRLNFDGWMSGTAALGAPGVDEVLWLQPARAGQVLLGRASVLKARISQSKPELGFVQFRHELIDDLGRLVMAQTNYVMFARRDYADRGSDRPTQKKTSEPVANTPAASSAMPKIWTDKVLGERIGIGATEFSRESIMTFARVYDPQSFHVDEVAAKSGPFGALAASGWHTASAWMNAYVQACHCSGAVPGQLVSIADLRWLRPVYASDTIAWDFTMVAISSDDAAGAIMTSRNAGTNQDGVTVFEFSAKMAMPVRR